MGGEAFAFPTVETSHVWTRIMSVTTIVENNTRWIIGNGDIDPRSRKWLEFGIFPNENTMLKKIDDEGWP